MTGPKIERREPERFRCARGHDLTIPGAVKIAGDVTRCVRCLAAKRRREYRAQQMRKSLKLQATTFATCESCGREKYADSRRVCLACKSKPNPDARLSIAQVDSMLADCVILETAPKYVKDDPALREQWIRDHRGLF